MFVILHFFSVSGQIFTVVCEVMDDWWQKVVHRRGFEIREVFHLGKSDTSV
jgi:hypothetical protein